jgi:hypothetical protein
MILPMWFKNVNLHVHHFNLVTPTFFQHNSKWIENNKIKFYVSEHNNVINWNAKTFTNQQMATLFLKTLI